VPTGSSPDSVRLLASIDDAGDVFMLAGSSITIGHAAAGVADLPLLADLDALHARASLVESFHGGLSWVLTIEPGAAAPVVDGQPVEDPSRPIALVDGVEVVFGRGASFRVRRSDPSSASIMLELMHGAEVAGARRVLLMAFGEGGRVRVGPRRRRHIPVGGLACDIEIILERAGEQGPAHVLVRCEGGARRTTSVGERTTEVMLDLPLEERVDLALGAAPDRLPPFGIALRPAGL